MATTSDNSITSSATSIDRRNLFLISFATLFFEVLVIRWLSSEIIVFSGFKNLILMGALVGLGLGCATGRPSAVGTTKSVNLTDWFPVLFLILVGLITAAPGIGLTGINFVMQTNVFYWLGSESVVRTPTQLLGNVIWVIVIFALVVSVFDALGQLLGKELHKHEALPGYSINLLGSLAGAIAYTLLAFLCTAPPIWLIVGFLSLLPMMKKPLQLGAMVASVALAFVCTAHTQWSPYYRIETKPFEMTLGKEPPLTVGSHVLVNHGSFQRTIDLSNKFVEQHPLLRTTPEYITYNLPYEAYQGANDVLVVGAGSGNDVSAALRHNVKHVDAVEIDPTVMELGKTDHPEHPYNDQRVTRYVNDARNFIAARDHKYDLIVFGFLDSSVNFSMLSSVRLDNFLYTVESLELVTKSLAPNGMACLSFAAGPDWLRARLYQMVAKASGQEPIALRSTMSNQHSIVILWGPHLTPDVRKELLSKYSGELIPKSELDIPVSLCTDDWPFLYHKDRALTTEYSVMLFVLLLISGSITVIRFRLQPSSFFRYAQFMLLGAGFFLLETRAMLAIAVLFGSTWLVNSVVISLILLMAMLANFIVQKMKNLNSYAVYAALFVSLIILYMVPLNSVLAAPLAIRTLAAAAIVGLPFMCAGLVFSNAYSKTDKPEHALGLNIFGALIGGCLEYCSIIIGTRDLVLLALGVYIASLVAAQILGSMRNVATKESSPAQAS